MTHSTVSGTRRTDLIVIGAGIVGLSIAKAWKERNPRASVLIVDKEDSVAQHSSGRNSGVLHAGFYYAPDSLKARLTREGNEQLRAFCVENGIPVRATGKVVVTKSEREIPRLIELYERGVANKCELEIVDENQLRELEPYARTVGRALWSPRTAVANPVMVTMRLAEHVQRLGCEIRMGQQVVSGRDTHIVLRSGEKLHASHIVNAAGLYADSVAHWFGIGHEYAMLPFKGLYLYGNWPNYSLSRQVYPVPDPRNPFLGVHVTTTSDGRVKIGPTAIPAFRREDYGSIWESDAEELREIVNLYPRFLTSRKHNVPALVAAEFPKYLKFYLAAQAKKLVPRIQHRDFVERGRPGVRAQLLHKPDKSLVMDFLVLGNSQSTHMMNVVSPAWTSALAVGDYTVNQIHAGGFENRGPS